MVILLFDAFFWLLFLPYLNGFPKYDDMFLERQKLAL